MLKNEKGGFQRKAMTFCELTNFKLFEGFQKSCRKSRIEEEKTISS